MRTLAPHRSRSVIQRLSCGWRSVSRTPGSSPSSGKHGRAEPAEHCAWNTRLIHCVVAPNCCDGEQAGTGSVARETLLEEQRYPGQVTVAHSGMFSGISCLAAMAMQLPVSSSDRRAFTPTSVSFAPIFGVSAHSGGRTTVESSSGRSNRRPHQGQQRGLGSPTGAGSAVTDLQ